MSGAVTFHDSYWYCYANSTAMLLSSIEEAVSPRLVEVLTGVGLGAFVSTNGLPFFSGLQGEPDKGISRALEILGFAAVESAFEEPSGEDAFAQLRVDLEVGPVLLGPLDMTYLAYNPNRPGFSGVDHFVLAFGQEGSRFLLHDPAGFGHVLISEADLEHAWRADGIGYRRGHYRSWTKPRRIATPTPDKILKRALAMFRSLYAEAGTSTASTALLRDQAAIEAMADWISEGVLSKAQRGHLTNFALPLGVKRALDYADFFGTTYPRLALMKRDQAALFGRCLTSVMRDDSKNAIAELRCLAALETKIAREITK